ncbi:hypothetical protein SAMN05444266_107101 [Chitinophaga jiangningensis]|uniref:Uncharacterized protein n=1 Tax=Chitinophaga jiangningensis TaxID=1419482 RepID=A0A1M7H6D9_9BACT|nr:hypothetical protein [Chitinophaga jiangningensis]SHM24100.1 hypothetical protein SAMN05444266_107101 [Chitinophaga jiangningensis]
MKRFILSLVVMAGITSATMAQSAQYEQAMTKNIGELDSSATFTPDALVQKAGLFERIAGAEKSQWQPYYYAAYCNVMSALMQQDKSKVDALADQAEVDITKAEQLEGNSSEISCIKSLIATARLTVDPMNRAAQYGPVSAQALEEGKKLNAENPRVYLLQGQALLFTPEAFGGSKTGGKALLEVALQKYAAFKPAGKLDPNWGEGYAKQLLQQASK